MKIVLQRVSEASVSIAGKVKSEIKRGFLVMLGIEASDSQEDIDWLCRKLLNLRVFQDESNKMNLSLLDIKGEILLISQFTLYASTRKGNRPSFVQAAKPDVAFPLYQNFIKTLETNFGKAIATGEFGADMKVRLINDGPITIIIDSKNRNKI